MRIPKSDDINTFWNYAMTEKEIAEYLKKRKARRIKKEERTKLTQFEQLIAAE